MKRPSSLFWWIAGALALTIVIGTLAQWFVASAVIRPLVERELKARDELAVSRVAASLAEAGPIRSGPFVDTLIVRAREGLGPRPVSMAYVDQGRLVAVSPAASAAWVEAVLTPGAASHRDTVGLPRLRVSARRAVAGGHGEVLVLRPTRPRSNGLSFEQRNALLFLPIGLVLSVVVGLLLVRRLVARLRVLESHVARVGEGDFSVRVADRSGDEIGRLARGLDRMSENLAETRARLQANELQRRQLFADITHELATPLTSIRGYAETLLNPEVAKSGDEERRYVQDILGQSRRLDRLIRDLFELSRLEAGAVALDREPLDWAELCINTVPRFEARFREAGLTLTWRRKPSPAWIEADGQRMEQVFENLLTNALRYVPAGGRVELQLEPAPDDPGFARLEIADDGPGVPADALPHLFERFYRGGDTPGASVARAMEGSGLGLAIVREIVERHGGRVSAAARSPRGLRITVDLPLRDASSGAARA